MTRTLKRPSAARLTFQIAAAGTLVGIIAGGCSSEVKTVTVEECAGVPASGGHTSASGGAHSNAMGGSPSPTEMAGEAGIGQSGESSGGASGNGGSSGSLIVSGNGGTSGSSGSANGGGAGGSGGKSSGGSGGKSSGGSGGNNSAGSTNAGGTSGSTNGGGTGGSAPAVCGDAVVSPAEFCDGGKDKNTDLSYGCYACTTLPPATAGNSQQCDACLQAANKPSSCFACEDHRACYACLRRQPDSFPGASHCSDIAPDTETDTYPYTAQGLSDFCFNPNSPLYQTATGGPAGKKPRGLVCQALLACAFRTRCATDANSLFSKCYCGVSSPTENCADPAFVPKGPCVKEIVDADAPDPTTTGVALTLEIAAHFDLDFGNPWVVLPVVRQFANCANDNPGCADVCFPESSNTGGSGGSGASGGTSANTGGKAGTGGS